MKIAFCHHLSLDYWGGGEKWVANTAVELAKRGHDVEIYALPYVLDDGKKTDAKKRLEGVDYHEGKYFSVDDVDVTYVTYNPLSWLNFRTKRPRIGGVHTHAYWQNPNLRYGVLPLAANIVNRFLSVPELMRFDAIHTVTDTYHINHPRVFFIPNYVDSKTFCPCKEKEKTFTVAYSSRLNWQKGFDVMMAVKKKVEPEVKVKMTYGKVPEESMPAFLSSAHMTVIPSRVDTFGISIVESLLCGTPVTASRLETRRSLTSPYDFVGIPIFFATTVNEYVKTINLVKNLQPDEYKKICDFGRFSARRYEKDAIIDNIEAMMEQVANEG